MKMPISFPEGRPAHPKTPIFQGAPSLRLQGTNRPGADSALPLPLLQGGCAGISRASQVHPSSPIPTGPSKPVYLRCPVTAPEPLGALPGSFSGPTHSHGASQSRLTGGVRRGSPARGGARARGRPGGRGAGGGSRRTPHARPTGTQAEPAPGARGVHRACAGRGAGPLGEGAAWEVLCGVWRRKAAASGSFGGGSSGCCDGGADDWRDLRKQNSVCTKLPLVRGGNPRGSKRAL